jgi:SAM-dependent methyltransferase
VLERLRDLLCPMPNSGTLLRRSFSRYLQGSGIEIGALHRPLPLRGLPITRIRYVDRLSRAQLREHYPELSRNKLVRVDVVDDGESLSAFSNCSLDFIIANHFIEHARNPIGTIRTWLAKLKPGGIVYMAVPDMRCTFDSDRALTSLDHLIEDDRATEADRSELDYAHFLEYARLVDKKAECDIESHARRLFEKGYSIHFHAFVPRTFLEVLRYAQNQMRLPLEIRAYADTPPGGAEFVFILSRANEI